MPDPRIEGRVAVVTGAGQGLGRAIALKLAANGSHIVLTGRTRSKLDSVAIEIQAVGQTSTVVQLDVTNAEQVDQLRIRLEDAFAQVDILVNSAGGALVATLEETSEADWDRMLAVNLKGPFLMTRALLGLIRKSQNASIVNIASKVALKGYHPVAAYSAAKAGLLGFSRALAAELRDDEIRVVALCPGPVDTPMRWEATPDFDRKVVIDVESVAATVGHIVQLPRGVTMSDMVIESMHYD
jgi:NAD(P)-dependent dehydrogenase (short-subunit alcohol dehydrogenase family)